MRAGISTWTREAWHSPTPPAFEGMKVFAANPIIVAMLEERGALMGGGSAGALLPALLALPSSGDFQGDGAVVHLA